MTHETTMDGSPAMEIARPLRRLAARVLDWIILTIALGLLVIVLEFIISGDLDEVSQPPLLTILIVALIAIVYEVGMIVRWGQTLGKLIVRIKVVDATTGQLPNLGQSFTRMLILIMPSLISNAFSTNDNNTLSTIGSLAGLLYLLVALSILFYQSRRGWHDQASSTRVIKLPPPQ